MGWESSHTWVAVGVYGCAGSGWRLPSARWLARKAYGATLTLQKACTQACRHTRAACSHRLPLPDDRGLGTTPPLPPRPPARVGPADSRRRATPGGGASPHSSADGTPWPPAPDPRARPTTSRGGGGGGGAGAPPPPPQSDDGDAGGDAGGGECTRAPLSTSRRSPPLEREDVDGGEAAVWPCLTCGGDPVAGEPPPDVDARERGRAVRGGRSAVRADRRAASSAWERVAAVRASRDCASRRAVRAAARSADSVSRCAHGGGGAEAPSSTRPRHGREQSAIADDKRQGRRCEWPTHPEVQRQNAHRRTAHTRSTAGRQPQGTPPRPPTGAGTALPSARTAHAHALPTSPPPRPTTSLPRPTSAHTPPRTSRRASASSRAARVAASAARRATAEAASAASAAASRSEAAASRRCAAPRVPSASVTIAAAAAAAARAATAVAAAAVAASRAPAASSAATAATVAARAAAQARRRSASPGSGGGADSDLRAHARVTDGVGRERHGAAGLRARHCVSPSFVIVRPTADGWIAVYGASAATVEGRHGHPCRGSSWPPPGAASSSWLLTGYGRGRRKSGGGPAWQRCRLSLPRRCGAGLSRRWVWGRVDRLGGGGACRCSVGVAWDGRDAAHGRKGGPTG
ncbi:hypothetical protein BU14_0330s0006 [Porphyra umbilicalis]|uniref:Uncharacterized protein n=1 Tax=Porphyra umbilicalis TaxID=2786 RepID=A0A1X6NYU6_PORUM|nr:hypothetical protein BU14_0330s0006 [Porphyra umbilicalis]|eukprot:OSX73715.1 hypothetical protein BU14_0330s0006 [Porphyra umbilicalis]